MQTFFENNKKQIKVYVMRSNFDKINNAKPSFDQIWILPIFCRIFLWPQRKNQFWVMYISMINDIDTVFWGSFFNLFLFSTTVWQLAHPVGWVSLFFNPFFTMFSQRLSFPNLFYGTPKSLIIGSSSFETCWWKMIIQKISISMG